jgi:hypothetical protein
MFLNSNGEDLELMSTWVEERKVMPVIGSRVDIRDIDRVRAICETVYKGKGGLGKAVIEVIQS